MLPPTVNIIQMASPIAIKIDCQSANGGKTAVGPLVSEDGEVRLPLLKYAIPDAFTAVPLR